MTSYRDVARGAVKFARSGVPRPDEFSPLVRSFPEIAEAWLYQALLDRKPDNREIMFCLEFLKNPHPPR